MHSHSPLTEKTMKNIYKNLEFTNKPIDDDIVQRLVKKDVVDSFVQCLINPIKHEHKFITQFLATNQRCKNHTVVVGDMYGIMIPSTRLFYKTLSELIGAVFILKNQPVRSSLFTCIGSEVP